MQLLTFIVIAFIYKGVATAAAKCINSKTKCIQLCCKLRQYYVYEHKYCKTIPAGDARALWRAQVENNEVLEFMEYNHCKISKDPYASIPVCYSPYFFKTTNQVGLMKLYDVPCEREKLLNENDVETLGLQYNAFYTFLGRYMTMGLLCLYVMLICLPIMTIYTCRKGYATCLLMRLVTWYFVSMTAFLLATVYPMVFREDLPMRLYGALNAYGDLRCFFCVAACLWLNVIGFQIWTEYKRTNALPNKRKDHMYCICYFAYVWSISAVLTYIHKISAGTKGSANIANWIMLAITCFNILTFVILSMNICITRCGVANISNEDNFKCQLIRLIVRLGLMMGFPRMVIMVLSFFVYFDYSLCMYFCIPEPFVIFTVLVWKPSSWFICNFFCCCCQKSDETLNEIEVVHIQYEHDLSS